MEKWSALEYGQKREGQNSPEVAKSTEKQNFETI